MQITRLLSQGKKISKDNIFLIFDQLQKFIYFLLSQLFQNRSTTSRIRLRQGIQVSHPQPDCLHTYESIRSS